MERSTYIKRCLQDHLLDSTTYKRLDPTEATKLIEASTEAMKQLLSEHSEFLSDHEITYFKRCFQLRHRMPQFYTTPKVHKSPWKTRPICSSVNSTLGYLSKWVDRQLQKVVHLCPGYLRDSKSLLTNLKQLGPLPSTAVLIVADAVSMYTNIDITHSIHSLKEWLHRHRPELPPKFPTGMVIKATELIMTSNIFQFDNTFWHQQTGTAMGTSCACTFATIYYANHEETTLLPKYLGSLPSGNTRHSTPSQALKPMLAYGRLIDDTIQVWDTALLPEGMTLYNFRPTIQPDGNITTRTFIKPMNLQLYIPPQSAHSSGVLKSIIFGNVLRFWGQNTHQKTYISTTKDFYQALLNRGYRPEVLTPIFTSAASKIDQQARKPAPAPVDEHRPPQQQQQEEKPLFLHWEFHPRDIPRRDIRRVYKATLAPVIAQPPLGVRLLTIAYSNPVSLRRSLTKTQLEEPAGKRASNYIEQLD